jgi:hypothetical protein
MRTPSLAALGAATLLTLGALPVAAEPADVHRQSGATAFDATGAGWFDPNARVQVVTTNNGKGGFTVRYHGTLPAGAVLPAKAIRWTSDDLPNTCNGAHNWQEILRPNGTYSFICHND